jgi:hypothetical protein
LRYPIVNQEDSISSLPWVEFGFIQIWTSWDEWDIGDLYR